MDKLDIWSQPDALIFPSPKNSSNTISDSWYRRHLKRVVSLVGLDPSLYSGHSGRAGGATDLFNSSVAYSFTKVFGRWKSDVVLSYYREKSGMYDAIKSAFSLIASSLIQFS